MNEKPRKPYYEAQAIIGVENVEKLRAAGLALIHNSDLKSALDKLAELKEEKEDIIKRFVEYMNTPTAAGNITL